MTRRLPLLANNLAQHRLLARSADEGASANTPPNRTDGDPELFIRRAFETDAERGYALLFKRYYGPLCSHAARFVYARDVAEDIVGEVFSQFWQHQRHRSVTTSFRAYLFTMVRHAAFAHLRTEFGREQSTEALPELDPAETLPTPEQLLYFAELSVRIEQTIRTVPPQSQRVFVMSRFEGKKNGDIADELQISPKTVEGHITKVLNLLRRVLREDGLISIGIGLTGWLAGQGVGGLFALSTNSSFLLP